jgi:hypothetical protein
MTKASSDVRQTLVKVSAFIRPAYSVVENYKQWLRFLPAGPLSEPPTWRTRVLFLVWSLPGDLSSKGGPTSSYATADIPLRVMDPLKLFHHYKVTTFHPASCSLGTVAMRPRVKWSERETDRPPTSSSEVKNGKEKREMIETQHASCQIWTRLWLRRVPTYREVLCNSGYVTTEVVRV